MGTIFIHPSMGIVSSSPEYGDCVIVIRVWGLLFQRHQSIGIVSLAKRNCYGISMMPENWGAEVDAAVRKIRWERGESAPVQSLNRSRLFLCLCHSIQIARRLISAAHINGDTQTKNLVRYCSWFQSQRSEPKLMVFALSYLSWVWFWGKSARQSFDTNNEYIKTQEWSRTLSDTALGANDPSQS